MAKHAMLSPSGFKALMICPAKPAMERGLSDESNEYADEGTAAHFLAAYCLDGGINASAFEGRKLVVFSDGLCDWAADIVHSTGRVFTITEGFAESVQIYLNTVRENIEAYRLAGATVELFVEQSLPIGHITGEEGAEGTGDAVIIASFPDGRAVIEVGDLKFGMGVEVSAENNPQLMLYALGALDKFGMMYDIREAITWISQPRITPQPSEQQHAVCKLREWAEQEARAAAFLATQLLSAPREHLEQHCNPHIDACRFCKAKGDCKAFDGYVVGALEMEFTDLTTADEVGQTLIVSHAVEAVAPAALGTKMDAVEMVEMWCKAIRGRVEQTLLAGEPVAGYKLVQGRRGARAWVDETAAEKLFKAMRLKKVQIYDFKVISPTSAEKLLKPTPKRWNRVIKLITQSDGKPSVAPLSDKRPALEIKPVAAEFEVIPNGAEGLI